MQPMFPNPSTSNSPSSANHRCDDARTEALSDAAIDHGLPPFQGGDLRGSHGGEPWRVLGGGGFLGEGVGEWLAMASRLRWLVNGSS